MIGGFSFYYISYELIIPLFNIFTFYKMINVYYIVFILGVNLLHDNGCPYYVMYYWKIIIMKWSKTNPRIEFQISNIFSKYANLWLITDFKLTWSNSSNIFALGWCIVQIIVRPPRAKRRNNEMQWKHEALSKPLKERAFEWDEISVSQQ